MDFFTLDNDEVLLLRTTKFDYEGALDGSELVLTNKRIYLNCLKKKKGLFAKKYNEVLTFNLDDVKEYEGKHQAKLSPYKNYSQCVQLELYFYNHVEYFVMEKRLAATWAETICETLGDKVEVNTNGIDSINRAIEKGATVVKGAIDTVINVFKPKKNVTCRCENCGASVTGFVNDVIDCPYCNLKTTIKEN